MSSKRGFYGLQMRPKMNLMGTQPESQGRRSGLRRAGFGLLIAAWALAGPARSQDVEFDSDPFDQRDTRLFTLSQDREAERTARSARVHLAAGRYERAIEDLQRLIELHRTDVLPAGFEPAAPGVPSSIYPAHLGAARWAVEQLQALPPAGLSIYESRYGEEAQAALDQSLGRHDPGALLEIIERWPVASASLRAWWALGDLEMVRGHLDQARSAYERAESFASRREAGAQTQAAQDQNPSRPEEVDRPTRLVALDELELAGWRREDHYFELDMPPAQGSSDSDQPARTPLLVQLDPWTVQLPESPFANRRSRYENFNLIPIISGDTVYVSTTLEILAVDGATGNVLWQTPRPDGWTKLHESEREALQDAVDLESGLAAPAVGSGIVVAPLQTVARTQNHQDYRGITIMRPIPQRRLYAFDAETGEPLWNHAPPEDWDGGDLEAFEQQMSVSGPPVIVEGRVLVPCSKMEGRVKLHVACYDLSSGDLLWQSQVLTGQRELNMFNRHEREYSAPPVTIHGDNVLLVTQLGTVAALDLGTGRIRWQALYDQIPLPGTTGFRTAQRPQEWRNTPAVVADGTVLATPLDSEDLLGIELETGRVRWVYPKDELRPRTNIRCRIDTLLGALSLIHI